ncbi:ClpP/crotonase-like domain-containing protein [Xylaria telfairii]|nr:ClpP/crotonase-like domain-containing protein [Xylaria telfairii]
MHSPSFLFLTTWAMATVIESRIITTKVTPSYWRATFSNPPFNLMDNGFFEDFYSLVDNIAGDPDVKVVVFDSNVEHFFIAHFDVLNPVSPEFTGPAYWGNITRLANLPVLTIAAIEGIARGGGAELAAALDVRFGSKGKAILGQFEVGTGAFPGGGGLRMLPRLTGRGRALEIVLGADDFDADTAALYGWINRAIPDHQFAGFVDRFARRVAGWDRYGINYAKNIINKSGFPTVEEVYSDFVAFEAAVSQGAVPARVKALAEAGLQSNVTFEIELSSEELRFVGPGPWNV